MTDPILQQIIDRASPLPSPDDVVKTLLELEKTAKKQKPSYSLQQLCKTWQLYFVTGTQKTRQRAGVVLGAGKYLPKFIKIQLIYLANCDRTSESDLEIGTVVNSVECLGFKITLTGSCKLLAVKNILAFDFTRMTIQVGKLTLYQGFIRGGLQKEKDFRQESIAKQAFFSYFFVTENAIAARGRGGGLALWIAPKST
jgi:hypothetical protein